MSRRLPPCLVCIKAHQRHIVAVFENMEPGDFRGKTILNLVNGAVAIDEDLLTVMGILEAR
jgi:hypothetical protein